MGHSPENALAYTRQHYPDFIPGVAAPVAAPVVAPVSQQPVPAAQPVAQPAIAPAPAVAAPVAPVAAPAAVAPSVYAPMAGTPLPASGTTPMMWAAVGCIVFALMLSLAGQFSHSWIVNNEEGAEGQSLGLTTIRQDCSVAEPDADETKQQAIDECKAFAYVFFAEDMESASGENITVADLDDAIVGDAEDVCDNAYAVAVQLADAFSTDEESRQAAINEAGEGRDSCLETPAAGSTGGLILWLGSIGALLG
ncbi:MAG: hypothetical protein ACPGMY_07060, partial [Poseidonia sp.]